jgi:beta-galactosidase
VAWHVGNEYGTYCYCENCAKAFRQWLKERYGSLEELNKRWYTNFWGHTIYDWDEIVPPSHLSETFSRGYMEGTYFQGMAIDYNRFMSDSSLACYKGEYDIIKEITPDMPVTTNLMGTFKPLDYFSWAKHMDVISWDNYPSNKAVMSNIAMRHDLMRGLKAGQPFMLMEQTPSQQNWQPYNGLKRPGIMRLWSYQAVAHGADTVMFFQLRQSRGACEKYHGAVISHAGHENTRVFREVSQLGEELKKLGDKILDSRINARVAIIFDWENWWATEYSSGPSIDLKYVPQVEKYYKAFYDMNIPVDMINEDADFSGYDVVIAPLMYMVKPGVNGRLEDFVKNGGTFVTTFFSGLVDENDLVVMGGYPGQLRQLLGIWAEETDALFPDMKNSIIINRPFGNLHGQYQCGLLCDIVHLEGAQALGAYGSDFYAGMPAITVNDFGSGKAYYVASDPEDAFVKEFVRYICDQKSIKPIMDVPANVEVTQRIKDNTVFIFILNHNEHAVMVDLGPQVQHELLSDKYLSGASAIPARGVFILES